MTQGDRSTTRQDGLGHVLAELRTRGVRTVQAHKGEGADLVASGPGITGNLDISIRTRRRGRDHGWFMGEPHEKVTRSDLVYVFVDLESPTPLTYVIPAAEIANLLRVSHRRWLAEPGRGGRPHRDGPMRKVLPDYGFDVPGYPAGWIEQYRDRWDLITAAK